MEGFKQSIDADSSHLISNIPQIKMFITHFFAIPGEYFTNQDSQTPYKFVFNDPSPAQYAIIQNKPKALSTIIQLSCNPPNPSNSKYNLPGCGLSFDDVFIPKSFSTNCKLPILNLAVRTNNFKCLKILVEYLKDNNHTIDIVDRDNHTPLLEAVLNANSELSLYLLREGSDPLFVAPTTKNNGGNCRSSPSLARPLVSALFAYPELFLYMVQTLQEMNQKEKYEVLFREKYHPTSLQIVPPNTENAKSLMEILNTRPDLALSRKVFQYVMENSEINIAVAIEGAKNTINPQHISVPVQMCNECRSNPSCCVCPICNKHLCPQHESNHDCR